MSTYTKTSENIYFINDKNIASSLTDSSILSNAIARFDDVSALNQDFLALKSKSDEFVAPDTVDFKYENHNLTLSAWNSKDQSLKTYSVSTAEFEKGRILESVSVGQCTDPTDPYFGKQCLILDFKLEDGSIKKVYVELSTIASNLYKSSESISISQDLTITTKDSYVAKTEDLNSAKSDIATLSTELSTIRDENIKELKFLGEIKPDATYTYTNFLSDYIKDFSPSGTEKKIANGAYIQVLMQNGISCSLKISDNEELYLEDNDKIVFHDHDANLYVKFEDLKLDDTVYVVRSNITLKDATTKISAAMPQVYQILSADDATQPLSNIISSDAKLSAVEFKQGDVLVVGDKLDIKTAYQLDRSKNWIACQGNIDADKVYFKDGFIFAGNYTLGLNKKKTTDVIKYSKLSSFEMIMNDMFKKEEFPAKPTPTTDIAFVGPSSIEVGSNCKVQFKISTDVKTYEFGSNTIMIPGSTTGLSAERYEIKFTQNGESKSYSGNWTGTNAVMTATYSTGFEAIEGTNCTNISLSSTFLLPEASKYVPITNLSNECPQYKVDASSATKALATNHVNGYYGYFYGYKTVETQIEELNKQSPDFTKITSTMIRSLNGTSVPSAFPSVMTTTKGKQWIFACKKGKKTKIQMLDGSGAQAQTVNGPYDVQVNVGGGTGTSVTYSLFYAKGDVADAGTNSYTIIAS